MRNRTGVHDMERATDLFQSALCREAEQETEVRPEHCSTDCVMRRRDNPVNPGPYGRRRHILGTPNVSAHCR
jgi:hypothetical protein